MSVQELSAVASSIASKGKGILAADESTPTIAKRFAQIDTESNEESRRGYRELLFTTPGVSEFISGVILFDETLRQATKDGVPFTKYLSDHGMIPGPAAGTKRIRQRIVATATSSTPACCEHFLPDMSIFGFSNMPL